MKKALSLGLLSILICAALPADDLVVGTDGSPVLIRGAANGGAIQIKANSASFDRWLRLGQVDNSMNFYSYMHMSDGGDVGIATTSPARRLDVQGLAANSNYTPLLRLATNDVAYGGSGGAVELAAFNNAGQVLPSVVLASSLTNGGSGTHSADFRLLTSSNGTLQDRLRVTHNGRVGINNNAPAYTLDVDGDAHFTGTVYGGNIQATYQDVAEWVPASFDLEPGTVVVLNPDKSNEVMPSSNEYDTTVAGVVSPQPGIILGVRSATKEMIATTGRVRVRVDATAGPIRVGDLLVTSSKSGVAMRSEPIAVGGRRIHQPGTIIGKALEPLAGGSGEILVLLSLQ